MKTALIRTGALSMAVICGASVGPARAATRAASTPGCFGARSGVAFFDNFSSASSLKPWKPVTGRINPSTESQWYNPRALSVSGGRLTITASHRGGAYYSGRISTQSNCRFLYGSIQARIWTPAGQGLRSAFWLENQGDRREIDVMESLGGRPNLFYAGVHKSSFSDMHSASGNFDGSWHVYGVLWTATGVTFTIDGHPFCSRSDAINTPLYLVLDLIVTAPGGWGGPPDASTPFPAAMNVDWVKAYKLGHQPPLLRPTPQQCQLQY